MSFNYQVILNPKDIKFSEKEIPSRFDNGKTLIALYNEICSGKTFCKNIPAIEVVWDSDRWDWYTLNNRRLWVFKELEKCGKISFVGMSRVELVDSSKKHKKTKFYENVELYDPLWDSCIKSKSQAEKDKHNKLYMSIELADLPKVSKAKLKPQKEKEKKQEENSTSDDDDDDVEWVEKSVTTKKNHELDFKSSDHHHSSSLSLASNVSLSSISRKERVIDNRSGLHGYGYYNAYKTEYLDKIKKEKKALLKKYKPYDVGSSYRNISRSSSFQNITGSSRSYSCESVFSETVYKKSRRSSIGYSPEENVSKVIEKRTRRTRLFSDNIDSGYSGSNSSELVRYNSSASLDSGIKLFDLYSMWQKRRIEYLRSTRLALTHGSAQFYLCGLCFKKFCTIVDLQQHCESLLHYACITCGKFFSSYASLGQHCQRLRHQKD